MGSGHRTVAGLLPLFGAWPPTLDERTDTSFLAGTMCTALGGCVGLLPRLRLGHGARWARSPASLADHSLRRQALYDAGDVGCFHLRGAWLPVRPGFLPGTPTAAGLATAPPDSHHTSLPDVRVPLCRCRLPREGRVHRPREWTVPPTAPGSAVVKLQGPLSSLKFLGLKNSVPVANGSQRAGGRGLVFRVKDSGSIRNRRLAPGPAMEKLPAQAVSPERGDLAPSRRGGGGGRVTGALGPAGTHRLAVLARLHLGGEQEEGAWRLPPRLTGWHGWHLGRGGQTDTHGRRGSGSGRKTKAVEPGFGLSGKPGGGEQGGRGGVPLAIGRRS